MKKQSIFKLPSSILDEVLTYLEIINENSDEWYFEEGLIESDSDISYWLENKHKHEGKAQDLELIHQIKQDQKIINPIIIDTTNEYAVEGRHRLTAAKQFHLKVPVICIFKE